MDAGPVYKYERHGTHFYMYGTGAKTHTSSYNNREKTTGSAVRDMRIVPYFNGIEGYRTNTGYSLSDDWDVGIFQDSCCQVEVTNVQVVGYWRIAAYLMGVSSDYGRLRQAYSISGTSTTPSGKGFDTHLDLVRLQGQVGMMIRGGCFYRAVACTADTVAIPWDESHPFPNAGSPDRTFGSPKGTFSYASGRRRAISSYSSA